MSSASAATWLPYGRAPTQAFSAFWTLGSLKLSLGMADSPEPCRFTRCAFRQLVMWEKDTPPGAGPPAGGNPPLGGAKALLDDLVAARDDPAPVQPQVSATTSAGPTILSHHVDLVIGLCRAGCPG